MSKHTPEPWRVLDGGCDGGIATVQTSHITRDVWEIPRCAEDLHRIVACVNACEGMDDPAAEIERLRARVAELEETVRFSEDQRRMLFDAATKLEAECDRLQSLANVYRTEVTASRNERAAFFSRTMNYEQWQAASRQVEIARADTESARAANGEVGR